MADYYYFPVVSPFRDQQQVIVKNIRRRQLNFLFNNNTDIVDIDIDIVESWSKEMWLISYITCVVIIAQVSLTLWSIFLFLDVQTLKLRIIIIFLTKIILSTARTTKN